MTGLNHNDDDEDNLHDVALYISLIHSKLCWSETKKNSMKSYKQENFIVCKRVDFQATNPFTCNLECTLGCQQLLHSEI